MRRKVFVAKSSTSGVYRHLDQHHKQLCKIFAQRQGRDIGKQPSLISFSRYPTGPPSKKVFLEECIRLVADNCLSLSLSSRKSFHRYNDKLAPGCPTVDPRTLRRHVLKKAASVETGIVTRADSADIAAFVFDEATPKYLLESFMTAGWEEEEEAALRGGCR